MKLVRHAKISYVQPANLPAGITAGFSTRNGGVSRPPYNSLNLGFGTDDLQAHVEGNRSTFARAFDLPAHLLLTVKQVHGDNLLLVDQPNPDLSHFLNVEVDAIVTDQPGIMIGVLTADCFPVLIWHPSQRAIAVIHAGWRGAANGLIGKTVRTLHQEFGCQPADLCAAIGPGISAAKYEVDRPVRNAFKQGTGFWNEIARETRLGHWSLDVARSCHLQLEQAGLAPEAIEKPSHCSYAHAEMFFSHRRDNGKTGRQLGFIMLDKP